MKKISLLTAALAALILTGCGAEAQQSRPEATPYVNVCPETENTENRQTVEEIIRESEEKEYVSEEELLEEFFQRVGDFFFREEELNTLRGLNQSESCKFSVSTAGFNEMDEKKTELHKKINEISLIRLETEDEDSEELKALIEEQNGYAKELDVIRRQQQKKSVQDAYDFFSSFGLDTQLRKMTRTEDGESVDIYICIVKASPEELLSLSDKADDYYLIGILSDETDKRFDELIMESGA